MAVYDPLRSYPARRSVPGYALEMIRSVFAAITDWNEARATRQALLQLSDRELSDLGLDRGWVEEVAHRR